MLEYNNPCLSCNMVDKSKKNNCDVCHGCILKAYIYDYDTKND